MRPIAVPVGDPAGIGPEVAVAAAVRVDVPLLLIGDAEQLRTELRRVGVDEGDRVRVEHAATCSDADRRARGPTAGGGRVQLASLELAIDRVLSGDAAAVSTGPVAKEAIVAAGTPFTGQTEHLASRCGLAPDAVTMCFVGPTLTVSLVTTHVSIRRLPDAITRPRVVRSVVHLDQLLAARGVEPPRRIAVLGLNPHAGEGGLFGDEEQLVVGPAIADATTRLGAAAAIDGPLPAEAGLRYAASARYAGVVAMFHDQATVASKLLDFGAAVNVTWGLPFVRTSVDHGVAYDIAGTGAAEPAGMIAAIRLAAELTAAAINPAAGARA